MISCTVYFHVIILDKSWNVSETTPRFQEVRVTSISFMRKQGGDVNFHFTYHMNLEWKFNWSNCQLY